MTEVVIEGREGKGDRQVSGISKDVIENSSIAVKDTIKAAKSVFRMTSGARYVKAVGSQP